MSARVAVIAFLCTLAAGGQCAAQSQGFRVDAEAAASIEHLSGGRADWRSSSLEVLARNAERRAYYGRLRDTERFDLRDDEAMLGTYQPFAGSWGLQLEASASSTHRVLAEWSALAQLERRFEHGWGVQGGYRRSEFDTTGTDLVIGAVDRYFSSFRAAYTLYLGRPDGAGFGASHRVQVSYYYSERSFIGLSAAAGREVENVVPDGLLTSRVRSLSLAGRQEFARSWAVSYELFRHQQGSLYTRRGLALGLRHAF
jgi:YaiO family outer membrane protein